MSFRTRDKYRTQRNLKSDFHKRSIKQFNKLNDIETNLWRTPYWSRRQNSRRLDVIDNKFIQSRGKLKRRIWLAGENFKKGIGIWSIWLIVLCTLTQRSIRRLTF